MEKEALFGRNIGNGRIECGACARLCKIPEGSHGFCYVRQNKKGKLRLVNYGIVSALQIDPIEKKPFNHFMPGSYVLGIGTSSCNWGCQFCQNHFISKDKEMEGRYISPDKIVERALESGVEGIAFTYNEPTIFIEYALDVARAAHKKGLFNVFVTNGYMTRDVVKKMAGLIDAAVVNIKGNAAQKFSNKFEMIQSSEPIREALVELKKHKIHVEMTDLIIPRVGEDLAACDEITKWISGTLGQDTPLHFTRFHPDYKMLDYPSTRYETLKNHYDIAKKNGLKYVYIGNVPGSRFENTYCPECGKVAVERKDLYLKGWHIGTTGRCKCGTKIPVFGRVPVSIEQREITSIY